MPRHRNTIRRPAFTFVELMIGLCIMALAGLAASALLTAVGIGWQQTDEQQVLRMTQSGISNNIRNLLRGSRLIGVAYGDYNVARGSISGQSTGASSVSDALSVPAGAGAACMFWKSTADSSQILLKDVGLLEHDIPSGELRYWAVPATAPNAGVQLNLCDMDDPSDIPNFRALPNIVCRVVARNVTRCSFNAYSVNASSVARCVEFHLQISDGRSARDEYGTSVPWTLVSSTDGL